MTEHKLILKAKKEQNLSNYAIAKKAGINRQIVDSYFNNKGYAITAEKLLAICKVLNIELKQIILNQ